MWRGGCWKLEPRPPSPLLAESCWPGAWASKGHRHTRAPTWWLGWAPGVGVKNIQVPPGMAPLPGLCCRFSLRREASSSPSHLPFVPRHEGEQSCLSALQPPHLPGSAVPLVGAHPSQKPSAPLGLQVIPEYQEPTSRSATRRHLSSAAPVTKRLYQASGCRSRRPAFRSFCNRHRIDDNTLGTCSTMLILKMDQRMLRVKADQAVK